MRKRLDRGPVADLADLFALIGTAGGESGAEVGFCLLNDDSS